MAYLGGLASEAQMSGEFVLNLLENQGPYLFLRDQGGVHPFSARRDWLDGGGTDRQVAHDLDL